MKKKKSFICLWLSSLLSVVFQWVLRIQAYIFWAPLVYVWGINSFYGWSLVSPWAYVDGETFGLMQGDSGVPDSFTQVPLFFFFFLRKSRKKNGQLLLSLMEACVWTLLKDVTTGQRLGRPRWGNRSQDSPRKELNPHSNCYKQRGEAPAQAAGKEPVVVAQA